MKKVYPILNYFFFCFHSMLILFIVFGWAFQSVRVLHLATIGLTAFSWLVLGIWKGLGYCICTDLHWRVRSKIGLEDPKSPYIHFLILKSTGINFPQKLVGRVTNYVFLFCSVLSLYLYFLS